MAREELPHLEANKASVLVPIKMPVPINPLVQVINPLVQVKVSMVFVKKPPRGIAVEPEQGLGSLILVLS